MAAPANTLRARAEQARAVKMPQSRVTAKPPQARPPQIWVTAKPPQMMAVSAKTLRARAEQARALRARAAARKAVRFRALVFLLALLAAVLLATLVASLSPAVNRAVLDAAERAAPAVSRVLRLLPADLLRKFGAGAREKAEEPRSPSGAAAEPAAAAGAEKPAPAAAEAAAAEPAGAAEAVAAEPVITVEPADAVAEAEAAAGLEPDAAEPDAVAAETAAMGAGRSPENLQDARGNLLAHFGDGDAFYLLSIFGGAKRPSALNVVSAEESRFTQTKYDAALRLVSKMVWDRAGEAPEPVSRTVYHYADSGARYAARRDMHIFADNAVEETVYNADGLVTAVTLSRPEKDEEDEKDKKDGEDEKEKKDEKNAPLPAQALAPVSETRYSYDDKKRVTEKNVTVFGADGKRETETLRYRYTENSDEPDTREYRNGRLTRSVVHRKDKSVAETYFLPNGYSVEVLFRNGVVARERYLLNGREVKRQDYDE